jgi:microcystin-dependent protein
MKKELLFVILFLIISYLFFTVERYDKNKTKVTGDIETVFVPLDRTKHVYFNQDNVNAYPVLVSLDLNHGFIGNEYIECKDGGIFNSQIQNEEEVYLFNCKKPEIFTEIYNKPDCNIPDVNTGKKNKKNGKCECPYYKGYDDIIKRKVGNLCEYDDGICVYEYTDNNVINLNLNNDGSCGEKNIPQGTIVAWNKDELPDGWILCDGNNKTPDLRGRFILGYNNNELSKNGSSVDGGMTDINTDARVGNDIATINSYGGEQYHKLTLNEMPAHVHYLGGRSYKAGGSSKIGSTGSIRTLGGIYSTYSNGGNMVHNNVPPYYVLKYIMKK